MIEEKDVSAKDVEKKVPEGFKLISDKDLENLSKRIAEIESEKGKTEQVNQNPSSGLDTMEIIKRLTDVLDERNETRDDSFNKSGLNYSRHRIKPEDVLSEAEQVIFWNPTVGMVIADDRRFGAPVPTPYGENIIFKYEYEVRKGTGKEVDLVVRSKYICKSKEVLKWLRDDSRYGVLFFEKESDYIATDSTIQHLFLNTYTSLTNVGDTDIINLIKQWNSNHPDDMITMSDDDISKNRMRLAVKTAEYESGKIKGTFSKTSEENMFDREESKKTHA